MDAPVLTGPRVLLRPFEASDVAARQAHGWHASIERNYGHVTTDRAMTADEAEQWRAYILANEAVENAVNWMIVADDDLAGFVCLHTILEPDRRARLAIGMFSPAFQNRGLGTEAMLLALHHGFGQLGLHRVDLRVLDFNDQAVAAYRRCGFVYEGRERETCLIDGRWYDDLVMSVLENEVPALPQ